MPRLPRHFLMQCASPRFLVEGTVFFFFFVIFQIIFLAHIQLWDKWSLNQSYGGGAQRPHIHQNYLKNKTEKCINLKNNPGHQKESPRSTTTSLTDFCSPQNPVADSYWAGLTS